MEAKVVSWIRQETTTNGIAILLAVLGGVVTWSLGSGVAVAVAGVVGGVTLLILPGQPAASNAVAQLAKDGFMLVQTRNPATIGQAAADLVALINQLPPSVKAVPIAPAAAPVAQPSVQMAAPTPMPAAVAAMPVGTPMTLSPLPAALAQAAGIPPTSAGV